MISTEDRRELPRARISAASLGSAPRFDTNHAYLSGAMY